MKMYILFILLFLSVVICFLFFSAFTSPTNKISIGQKAPSFSLYDQNGNLFSLEDNIGKKMVIYFFPKAFTPG